MDNALIKKRNKEAVNRLYEEAIKISKPETRLDFLASPQCVESFDRFFERVCNAFPEPNLTIESLVVTDDRVMARYKLEGTPNACFMGISVNGQTVIINGLDIFRLTDGKVVEHCDTAYHIRVSPPTLIQDKVSILQR